MDSEKLQSKLLSAARGSKPSENVPYKFEKRVMSRILSAPAPDTIADYVRVFWRAAASCACIMFLALAFSFHSEDSFGNHDFETTVFASMSQHIDDSW